MKQAMPFSSFMFFILCGEMFHVLKEVLYIELFRMMAAKIEFSMVLVVASCGCPCTEMRQLHV